MFVLAWAEDEGQRCGCGCGVDDHQTQPSRRYRGNNRSAPLVNPLEREERRAVQRRNPQRRMLNRAGASLRRDENRHRAAFDHEHHQRPAEQHEQHGEQERGERDRLRQQHRRHRRQDVADGQRQQVARVAADQQHHQEHAADDRHREQRLEQSIRHELDEDDVPVGSGHECTALETVFEGQGRRRAQIPYYRTHPFGERPRTSN